MRKSTRTQGAAKKDAATNGRNFRTFLLVQAAEREAIGRRIAQARREAGAMTQQEFADLLNLSVRQVQNFEAGESVPWKYFQTLETVFKRPLGWFLHGEVAEGEGGELAASVRRIELALEALIARLEPDDQQETDQG
jgi:DNA-binding transcriptional regulator YiaG